MNFPDNRGLLHTIPIQFPFFFDSGQVFIFNVERAFLQDVQDTFAAVKTQDASGPLRVEDLPATLRNRFVGQKPKVSLHIPFD